MKVLFLGGNGNISWHCADEALKASHEVFILNREMTLNSRREIHKGVIKLKCDVRNLDDMSELIRNQYFDVVCDFICYNEKHAEDAVKIFNGKVKQYIFVSSESIYERKARNLPFKENCPKYSPETACDYIKGKLLAERVFVDNHEKNGFPITIVRPAYTYDTIMPTSIGQNCFTAVSRYLSGKPVLIAGDGNNLWTFTHSVDFARAFIHLLGNSGTFGEDYHIATDKWLTWNESTEILLNSLDLYCSEILHVPAAYILQTPLAAQKEMMYQKMWHNIYDISKIKKIAPSWNAEICFEDGIRMTLKWLYEKDSHRRLDAKLDLILEDITHYMRGRIC